MPSAKRRKAAKKKKEKEKEIGLHEQGPSQALEEDSGNEHEHDHELVNEDDVHKSKSSVETNEGNEGGSPVQQKNNHGKGRENPPTTSGFDLTCSTSSVVPENSEGRGDEPEVLFSGVVHDNNILVTNTAPLNDNEEGLTKGFGDGDEIYSSEVETITDVGLIGFNFQSGVEDESKVSSSNEVLNENESDQTTDVDDNFPKDATQVVRSPSPELESSDGDESKLDIASTMAVFDPNDSIQSLGSVGSPGSSQSISSQMFADQTSYDGTSNDGTAFMSQEKEGVSEGSSETLFKELSSELESAGKQPSKIQQEEDEIESNLYPDVIKGFKNDESNQIPNVAVNDNCVMLVDELSESISNCENIQGSVLISSGAASKESEAITEVEENIVKSFDAPLFKSESSTTKDTVVMSTDGEARKELVSTSGDLISTCGEASGEASREAIGDPISFVEVANGAIIPTREDIRDVISTGEGSGDMGPMSKKDSGNLVLTNGKCSEHMLLNSGDGFCNGREAHGSVASNDRESLPGVVSSGGEESREVMGSCHTQGTSVVSKATSFPKSQPQKEQNEKPTLLPRESRTSWFNCCGILELFTSSQS